jgi:hypothetical protein
MHLHIKLDDPFFCEATKQDGFDIRPICQPPTHLISTFWIWDFSELFKVSNKKNAKTLKQLLPAAQQVLCSHILSQIVHTFFIISTTNFTTII